MSLIVLLVLVYVGLYVVLSVPSVQNKVKDRICSETSRLLGGTIGIRNLTVRPFSEVILSDVTLDSHEGERCVSIEKVAGGLDLWTLVSERRIVLNYAEILDLYARIEQPGPGEPLNIQFLIDALSPKDRDKPSALFNVRIRNVVVRNSKASFSRPWMTDESGAKHRFAEIDLTRLRMDLSIPVLKNDLFRFDIRNIQFDVTPGVSMRNLSARVSFAKDTTGRGQDILTVKDLNIGLPNSSLSVGDFELNLGSLTDIDGNIDGRITPSDLSAFLPQLAAFNTPWVIGVDASLHGKNFSLEKLELKHSQTNSSVSVNGEVRNFNSKDSLDIHIEELKGDLSPRLVSDALAVVPQMSDKGRKIIESLGRVTFELTGGLLPEGIAEAIGFVNTAIGDMDFSASGSQIFSKKPSIRLEAEASEVELDRLLATNKVGKVSADIKADITGLDRNAEGHVKVISEEFVLMGNLMSGIDLNLKKEKDKVSVNLEASSKETLISLDGDALLAGSESKVDVDITVSGFNPSSFGLHGKMADSNVSAILKATTQGNNADNLTGDITMQDLKIIRTDGKKLELPSLTINIDSLTNANVPSNEAYADALLRDIRVNCDWVDARITGRILPGTIASEMRHMASTVFPTLIFPGKRLSESHGVETHQAENDFTFDIDIKGASAPYVFFDTPVRPLTDIPIKGSVDACHGNASLSLSTPHLQQGKNKLIRDVDFKLNLDAILGMLNIKTGLIFPAKKGDAELTADIHGLRDNVDVNIGINPTMESVVKGGVSLAASFSRIPDPFKPEGELAVRLDILPSMVTVNDKAWMIADGSMDYSGKRVSISNFLISHDEQFVKIDGSASESAEDAVFVRLNDIDLEYIFNILNINYVSFGGMASGEVVGRKLLTNVPEAKTEFLRVKGLSYNGAVLGDGDLASEYDARQRKVGIYGVIRDGLTRERRASVEGGIWITRDSLSFGFDANKINVGIMKPFVSAFCSDLYGEASGKCKLFGTFSDIDLIGDLKADTLSMKLDFTNTWYHAGGDSVFLRTGVIDIPPLTLYDDERHTAEFSGWLRHRYFHEPVFNFRLRDAESLLCYDTNEKINPLWYGTIYGSGHAQINGHPGLIEIDMNMTTEENSRFYYVISDAEDVAQYSFLTFTDRRKESLKSATVDSIPDYLRKFRKQTQEMEAGSSNVVLSLKGTVTNAALVTLVMDPKAGDNITARGQGALQMDYNLASNDLRMIGTYVLDEGNYNFTLQDIIIKNFNIRKGSLIKFDGDPMRANLDITATYRVNTNLTDLDKSFSTDKELNRTNVPVDAVLLVDGPMTNPDITFDIELPSLTSDVERKVKSIVSTNDMMSRQIIYLLALNRFYTPEYTGGQSNGSEWSSMASSTISSQLSNILSQMTDKLDVAPSFRSEKGDFSDMEFDLALSSRLLNNRLLINGNFGYRDRTTSNTQFVGDFDIEYLLNKSGNLRLKAYNHFNDQNYYLRSALTTQGVGVVFRKDFDSLFRKKKDETHEDGVETADSIGRVNEHEDLELSRDSIIEIKPGKDRHRIIL